MNFDAPHELTQICLLGWSQVFVVTCLTILLRRFSLAAIGLLSWGTRCIQTDTHTHTLSQSVLCNSALSCEPTRNLFCGHIRPDTTPQPVAASDGKEGFLCVRMEFILAYVDPAGCTTSDGIDAPILHNECRHLHETNAVSFWWSPDVGTSLLCILVEWNVESVGKYRESASKAGLSYPSCSNVTKHVFA